MFIHRFVTEPFLPPAPGIVAPRGGMFSGAYCKGGNAMHSVTRCEQEALITLIVYAAKRTVCYLLYILTGELLVIMVIIG